MKAKISIPGLGEGWVDLKDLNYSKIRITDVVKKKDNRREK